MTPLRRATLKTRTLTSFLRITTPHRLHSTGTAAPSSVSADELSHFSALASSWWDPMGPSRVLHLMNPLRHEFIASCLAEGPPAHDQQQPEQLQGPGQANLHYLDVGCGGGIFAESLARTIPSTENTTATPTRAASITAIDPSTKLVQIAREHARIDPTVDTHLRTGRFSYQNRTLEDIIESSPDSSEKKQFDIVTLFEVLEHIDPSTSSPLAFLTNCLRLVKPGGWLVGSTIARSFPSFLVNQVIAEAPWPIGVVPRGTHEWSKFVNPSEVKAWVQEGLMRGRDGAAERAGSEALQGSMWKCEGVMYFPGLGWKIVRGSEDWGNYFWAVKKGI